MRFLRERFADQIDKIERDFNTATIYYEKTSLLRMRGKEIIFLCTTWPQTSGTASDVINAVSGDDQKRRLF
eukprot:9564472-Prorocentrum_lima.AAC.1